MNDAAPAAEETRLLASFSLGDAVFGVDAQLIQEVAKMGDVTPVRHAPPYVIGIRNLRGRVITVMDLQVKLDLGRVTPGPENRVLIVESQGEPIGLLVDSVDDMVSVSQTDIQPAPANVNGVRSRNLHGVFRGGRRLVAVLNLSNVLQIDSPAVGALEKTSP